MTHYIHIEGQALELSAESTFEAVARDWHHYNLRRWSSDHAETILRRLEMNLFPLLGNAPIGTMTAYQLMQVIRLVELRGALDLAGRMVQYCVGIFHHAARVCANYPKHSGNPALALQGSVIPDDTHHRPALPLERIPDFFRRLDVFYREILEMEYLAIQINLHTFVRSSELRFARWKEINLQRRIWEIPSERAPILLKNKNGGLEVVKYSERGSKMKTPHLVPLSRQVVEFFHRLQALSLRVKPNDLVVHAVKDRQRPMTDNRINHLLRKMGYDTQTEISGHGFRTMACSTLVESGHWSRDAIERQMSHQERDKVRAAYIHKAEHIHERKQLMQWWSSYLDAIRPGYIAPYEFAALTD